MERIGSFIRKTRKMQGMSQSELSSSSGLHQQEVSEIERDVRHLVSYSKVQTLLKGLGMDLIISVPSSFNGCEDLVSLRKRLQLSVPEMVSSSGFSYKAYQRMERNAHLSVADAQQILRGLGFELRICTFIEIGDVDTTIKPDELFK
mgnify:CR=1 FL=1